MCPFVFKLHLLEKRLTVALYLTPANFTLEELVGVLLLPLAIFLLEGFCFRHRHLLRLVNVSFVKTSGNIEGVPFAVKKKKSSQTLHHQC